MLSLLLLELGGVVEELLLEDGLLDEPDVPEAPEAPDWSLEPLVPALPLMDELPLVEPAAPGVVLLLEELGLVVSVEEDDELGEDGIVLVVADGVAVLLVPDLLRSQPVTAAVATASTATKGMSLFMTSPFRVRLWGVRRSLAGPRLLCFNEPRMQDACQALSPREAGRQGLVASTSLPSWGNPFPLGTGNIFVSRAGVRPRR
ncbi:MAG TPA: hypothetical protein VN782_11400 [Usitatibacter sp.]|nr:hypothetical protein [Usitatibacter sp.]